MSAYRVATWNIHGFVGADGVRDVGRVAAVLRSIDADIVGLQEVDCRGRTPGGRNRLEHLAALTGLHATFGPTVHGKEGAYGNALLTRVHPTKTTRLDVSFEGSEPRGLLSTELPLAGTSLTVIVAHFGLRARERVWQLESLLQLVGDAGPVLVMGDFNEWHPRSRIIDRLNAALGGPSRRVRTFPSRFPFLALDRIWARPHARLTDLGSYNGTGARLASDHLPVRAQLTLGQVTA